MDYGQYVIMFHNMHDSLLSYPARLYVGKDPLFGALIIAIQSLGLGPQWLFLTAVALALAAKARAFVDVFGAIVTPLFATICMTYFLHEFTQIRVAIALGFAFLALVELCNGRKMRWVIYSIIAVGFHVSALALIPFELPLAFGMRTRMTWSLSGLSLVMLAAIGNFLSSFASYDGRVTVYIGDTGLTTHMLIVGTFKIAIVVFLSIYLTAKAAESPERKLLMQSCLLAVVGYVLMIIFMDRASGFAFRIYELFDAFSVFVIAAAFLRRSVPSWFGAFAYCAVLLILLSTSALLLPYQLAPLSSY
nr:EpsG family protein [Rhodanobacter glycinis]